MYENIGDYKMYVEIYNYSYETSEPTEGISHFPTLSTITIIPSIKQNTQNTHKIDNIELIIIIPSVCFILIVIYIAFRIHKIKHIFENNKLTSESVQFGTTIDEIDI